MSIWPFHRDSQAIVGSVNFVFDWISPTVTFYCLYPHHKSIAPFSSSFISWHWSCCWVPLSRLLTGWKCWGLKGCPSFLWFILLNLTFQALSVWFFIVTARISWFFLFHCSWLTPTEAGKRFVWLGLCNGYHQPWIPLQLNDFQYILWFVSIGFPHRPQVHDGFPDKFGSSPI